MNAIVANDIHKRFNEVDALAGITFSVEEGELFGFVGPDGAGKTTLFRILVTLLKPDAGEAVVDGLDVVAHYRTLRTRLGYMPGRFSLYQDLTVLENLTFFASVFGTSIEENYDLVRDVYEQIEPFKDRKAGALSGGMKQKLALSCALIHRPRLLFLDEPTTGVDAVSRREFWEMLMRFKAAGITIVVSTPYMDEAAMCDRVALIQGGKILQVDRPATIEAQYDRPLLAVRADGRYALIQALRAYPYAKRVYAFGADLHYTDTRATTDPAALRRYLSERNFKNVEIRPIAAGIEDVFMALSQDA